MGSPYTRAIYKHVGVHIDRNDSSNYRVVAKTKLRKGTLLLMEHGLFESAHIMKTVVKMCGVLSRKLHPREPGTGTVDDHASNQVELNAFGDPSGMVLGYDISAINHSCNPNAAVYYDTPASDLARQTRFLSVYAVNAIATGEEIFISYNEDTGHDMKRGFSCNCGLDLNERTDVKEQAQLTCKMAAAIAETFTSALINKYILSSDFVDIYALHECAVMHGLYFFATETDAKWALTPRFFEQFASPKEEDDPEAMADYVYENSKQQVRIALATTRPDLVKRDDAKISDLEGLFCVGAAVRIHKLVSRPELNGVCGVVSHLLPGSGRCGVTVIKTAKTGSGVCTKTVEISFKFENLLKRMPFQS